ncbi:MAG: hypothetical protein M4579_000007 [Chaenotheca gracillima]|nr:MAG: hypothetical protein M4579_000007 [Chaenotheca gracillima]
MNRLLLAFCYLAALSQAQHQPSPGDTITTSLNVRSPFTFAILNEAKPRAAHALERGVFDELHTANGHGDLPSQAYWRPLSISEDIYLYAPSEAVDVPPTNNNSAISYPNAILTDSNTFTVKIDTKKYPLAMTRPFENYFTLLHFYTQPWEPSQDRPVRIIVRGKRYKPRRSEPEIVTLRQRLSRPGERPFLTELPRMDFGKLTEVTITVEYADTGAPWSFFLDSLRIRLYFT